MKTINADRPDSPDTPYVIDAETGLKRGRYGDEIPESDRQPYHQTWENYRDRRREMDSWQLMIPDSQTREGLAMPLKRESAIFMGLIYGRGLRDAVMSIRESEKRDQLTGEEAYTIIHHILVRYEDEFSFSSPEYQTAREQFDAHAKAHGWYDHLEVEELAGTPEADDYLKLPEVTEFRSNLEKSFDLFLSRLARECGEDTMARLILNEPEAHKLICEAGDRRLATEQLRLKPYLS